MKFTTTVPGLTTFPGGTEHWFTDIGTEEIVELARAIEAESFDYVMVSTHFFVNRQSAAEMGERWTHSLSAAGFLLGATTQVQVVCLILTAMHNPIELAKACSTLSFLSGGRFIPMFLAGYKDWEFRAVNAPFEERGEVMDEWLAAMYELWTSDDPKFEGKRVRFDDVVFQPKPEQPFTIWFGGRTKPNVRRVARYGHGWIPSSVPRSEIRDYIAYLYEQPELRARPRPIDLFLPMYEGKFDLATNVPTEYPDIRLDRDSVLDQLRIIADLGATITSCDDLLGGGRYGFGEGALPKIRSKSEYLERLAWIGENVLVPGREIVPPQVE